MKSHPEKLTTISEAVKVIEDGMHIALCGFAVTRCTIAFVHELIRSGKKDLTVSQCVAGMDTDLLVGAGCVRKLIYGGGSLDRFGPVSSVNRAIEEGTIEVEEYSSLAITFKNLAGALGLTFLPIKSMLGSQMLEELLKREDSPVKLIDCPFTREKYVALKALRPDVAIVHANMVDEEGNAIVIGPLWDLREMAFAAEKVIVTAERIAPRSYTEKRPELTLIPAFKVSAIVLAPFGSYPTGVFKEYDYDAEHLKMYAAASREGGRAYQKYLEDYIYQCHDHWEYLERSGGWKKLYGLLADLEYGY